MTKISSDTTQNLLAQ